MSWGQISYFFNAEISTGMICSRGRVTVSEDVLTVSSVCVYVCVFGGVLAARTEVAGMPPNTLRAQNGPSHKKPLSINR